MTRENMVRLIKVRNIILDEFYNRLCKDDLKFLNFKENLYEGYFDGIITFEDNIEVSLYYNYNNFEFCIFNVKNIDFNEINYWRDYQEVLILKDFFNTLYYVSYRLNNIEREEE